MDLKSKEKKKKEKERCICTNLYSHNQSCLVSFTLSHSCQLAVPVKISDLAAKLMSCNATRYISEQENFLLSPRLPKDTKKNLSYILVTSDGVSSH